MSECVSEWVGECECVCVIEWIKWVSECVSGWVGECEGER